MQSAAPEVTVTLVWRWPIYQSEMKTSVRCQGGAIGGCLGRVPVGQGGRAGPTLPSQACSTKALMT